METKEKRLVCAYIEVDDDDCGTYTPYFNDGLVGLPYETGLISWKDEYKTIVIPIHVE